MSRLLMYNQSMMDDMLSNATLHERIDPEPTDDGIIVRVTYTIEFKPPVGQAIVRGCVAEIEGEQS